MTQQPDSVVRAMTDDGSFRVIAARTTQTVRGSLAAQSAHGVAAVLFGDLLTGAVLVRETMAPTLRVQGILRGAAARGRLVADSHPDGMTRGLVTLPRGGGELALGGDATLEMMRSLPNGALHKGVVEVPLEGGVSTALMAYMQTSEQVASMIAVATVIRGDEVVSAGGYIVQLLPELDEGPLMVMTERLKDFQNVDHLVSMDGFTPDLLLSELLYGMPFTRLEESPVQFGCNCSQVRVVMTLSTLPRGELEELIEKGEILEIACDYCRTEYHVAPAQLRGLLEKS